MKAMRTVVRLAALTALVLAFCLGPASTPAMSQEAATPALPFVAIHVSELTQALETMPAMPPTPTGTGNSGYEWWYTSWRYFVMHESMKEALRSDGTPYVVVSDADITAGALLHPDGSPKYPIVISLATEAVRNDEIAPLRAYVDAGGFLFVGSSAFTRNPDGTTRGNFALATEMGLQMVGSTLSNWAVSSSFNKVVDGRLVAHIPWGSLLWHMPLTSEEIPWGTTAGHAIHASHYDWRVLATGAEVLATGAGGPLVATRAYGNGRFIYHAAMQPILGHGSYDAGMYSYVIYRRAIEWAFESANVPIVKVSPWQYPYDAAFVIRHDFENTPGRILSIESSAQFEHSVGAAGDYFFCTGTIRPGSEDTQLSEQGKLDAIASVQRAVASYGATIGSHNGGLANPVNPTMGTGSYDYWHWGPDEAIDTTPAGYANGKAYALTSIGNSFTDIEGWMTGLDNGRAGCGTAGNCPRIWVSPYFNSTREDSYDIFEQLGLTAVGEQKCSPFPHWTLSTRTPAKRYSHLTLPVSDWYVGSDIAQALDYHNSSSMRAAVDQFHSLGALVNIYTHNSSNGGLPAEYVTYSLSKTRMWAANAVSVYDWWSKRSPVTVTPSYTRSGTMGIASATIAGATDPDTSVELVVPNWSTGAVANVQVLVNNLPMNPANYRLTDYGVKVKVGTSTSTIQVRYTPLETWTQTDWVGGAGQATWSDATKFDSSTGIDFGSTGQARLSLSSGGNVLFSDDFTRPPAPDPVPFTWTIPPTGTGNRAVFDTVGGVLNSGTSVTGFYGFAYPAGVSLSDYSVEADVRFPASAFGGGLMGRLNTSTGQRYGAWIYPDGSGGGSKVLKLLNFTGWTSWSGIPVQQVTLPTVGTGWHHLKMSFAGSRIRVYYDDMTTPVIDATDVSHASGSSGVDFWTQYNTFGPVLNNFVVRNSSDVVVFSDTFGADPSDQLAPWVAALGTWAPVSGVLRGSSGTNLYGYAYYNGAWTDYTVEGRVQFPAGAFGGGIGGRVDPATGAHYGVWIYPDSANVLRLIKYRDWTTWSQTAMQQVSLPSVGTGWHTLKLGFSGNTITVWYDGNQVMSVADTGFDGRAAYTSGGVSVDMWTQTTPYTMSADDIVVRSPATYGTGGTLLSSAFDGGVGVQWQTIGWDAAAGGTTGMTIRTRTADRADLLASAPWSAAYAASGSDVAGDGKRWIQYQVDLSSSDPAATPSLYETRVTYVPGILLPGSNLTYTGPASGDSQSDVLLRATLRDDDGLPIAGRAVSFTLDGLGTVSGTTDDAGLATATLHLELAPGSSTLAVAFAGDAQYAPVSIGLPFTIASPWSTWIQDTQADFQGNALTGVDAAAVPGSVVLHQDLVGEGEVSGAFTVNGQPGWQYRRALWIDNTTTSALRSGYSVKLTLDTAALVAAGKLRPDGNDLRVVFDDGTTAVELDRLAETAFNGASTEIWFKTQASIPALGREERYVVYYGNPDAGAPPASPSNVWALWDGFDGSSIDTAIWQPTGSVTVSGGQAHLAIGSNLFGRSTFTDARFEARLRLAAQNVGYSAWWGWEQTPSDAPNIIVFEEVTAGLQGLLRANNAPYEWIDMVEPARTDWHTYGIRWWSGNAVWMIDGSPTITRATGVPTVGQYANFNAPAVAYDVEFVRARLDAAADPTVSLASPQAGYVGEGRMLSIAHDTGGLSDWKYLTWSATTPTGTGLSLRVRTAATQAALASAPWFDYASSGELIANGSGRWIQYEAVLTASDPDFSPELQKVTIYYDVAPCTPGGACSTGQLGVCAAGTVSCDTGSPVCVRAVAPSPEACDGVDNDCSGDVDDGTAAIVIADVIPGTPNHSVTVPVTLGPVAGMGVYASDVHVTFDTGVLTVTGVAMNSALEAFGCAIESNLDNDDELTPGQGHARIAVFCTAAIPGNGLLANVTFDVHGGTCGTTTALHFESARLNEGCPAAVPDDGSIVSTCDVSGAVYYYRNNGPTASEPSTKPVPDVVVHPSGGGGNATTDASGLYTLTNLAGNQTITPLGKTGDFTDAIGSSDAAQVAMAAVGSISPLSANQFLAGDVTGNGTLSALDASNIARFAVGLVARFPVAILAGSDWKFLVCNPYGPPDNPGCGAAAYAFNPIVQSATARNFYAVLYGDVTGNWPYHALAPASRAAASTQEAEAVARDRQLTERFRREGAPPVIERRPGMGAAELSLSGWKPLRAGERAQLTVDLSNADGILGLDLVLRYDPSRIAIVGVQAAGIGSALSVARANQEGTQRIAAYGYAALSGSGSILTITVEGLKNNGRQLPPTIDGVANEGAVPLEVRPTGRESLPRR